MSLGVSSACRVTTVTRRTKPGTQGALGAGTPSQDASAEGSEKIGCASNRVPVAENHHHSPGVGTSVTRRSGGSGAPARRSSARHSCVHEAASRTTANDDGSLAATSLPSRLIRLSIAGITPSTAAANARSSGARTRWSTDRRHLGEAPRGVVATTIPTRPRGRHEWVRVLARVVPRPVRWGCPAQPLRRARHRSPEPGRPGFRVAWAHPPVSPGRDLTAHNRPCLTSPLRSAERDVLVRVHTPDGSWAGPTGHC